MIKDFFRPRGQHADTSAEKNTFDLIMEIATGIATRSPEGLRELVRALLLPLQAEHMLSVAEEEQHNALGRLEYSNFFFPVKNMSTYYLRDKPTEILSLGRDVLLPTAWKRSDYISALATIGSGKEQGSWRQDNNHVVSLLLPWRIGFVSGGNHSLVAGILMSEGEVKASEVFDMTSLLEQVTCDGKTYREVATNRVLGEVTDQRRAAVYEIGRMLMARQ